MILHRGYQTSAVATLMVRLPEPFVLRRVFAVRVKYLIRRRKGERTRFTENTVLPAGLDAHCGESEVWTGIELMLVSSEVTYRIVFTRSERRPPGCPSRPKGYPPHHQATPSPS